MRKAKSLILFFRAVPGFTRRRASCALVGGMGGEGIRLSMSRVRQGPGGSLKMGTKKGSRRASGYTYPVELIQRVVVFLPRSEIPYFIRFSELRRVKPQSGHVCLFPSRPRFRGGLMLWELFIPQIRRPVKRFFAFCRIFRRFAEKNRRPGI